MLALALTSALLAWSQSDEDITFIDRQPAKEEAAPAEQWNDIAATIVKPSRTLVLAPGDSVFVQLPLPKINVGDETLVGRVTRLRADGAATLLPYVEIDAGQRTAFYLVRALPGSPPGRHRVKAKLEILGAQTGRLAFKTSINHSIVTKEKTRPGDWVRDNHQAFDYFQNQAIALHRRLPRLAKALDLGRVDRPPEPSTLDRNTSERVAAYFRNRVRADICASRLIAIAQRHDSPAAAEAISALARLNFGPTAASRRIRVLDSKRLYAFALESIRSLRLFDARASVLALHQSGKLKGPLLGEVLLLSGLLERAQQNTDQGARQMQQAPCLVKDNPLGQTLPLPFSRWAADAVAQSKCQGPIKVGPMKKSWSETDSGNNQTLRITGSFENDPHQLVHTVRFRVQGPKSHQVVSSETRVEGRRFALSIPPESFDFNALQAETETLLLDKNGNIVAQKRSADRIRIYAYRKEEKGFFAALPWWAYAAAGVVAASAVGAAVVLSQEDNVVRGFGPIDISF